MVALLSACFYQFHREQSIVTCGRGGWLRCSLPGFAFFTASEPSRPMVAVTSGANDYILDEMERALHNALSIVKRTLESNTVVAGGGALAITEFAESLLIIPKVIAVNAAKDATELVAKLRAYNHTAQTKANKKHLSRYCILIVVHSQPIALGYDINF
ncbi:hypothetical protein ACOSQ3_019092 [Xanthoceras sorbifolium]